jgi:predicted  nucleic acid-binding Zn-ribbon protein
VRDKAPHHGAFFVDMHADLERLIALQRLDTSAQDIRRRLAEQPAREKALDDRLEGARQAVAAAKERLGGNQQSRRAIEKELAVHQGRLSKFRDQLMAVKTNVEYQAIQKEIGFAQNEVKEFEDQILELMVEADDLAASVKLAEQELAAHQKATDDDRRALASELAALQGRLDRILEERPGVLASLDPQLIATFDTMSRRGNGIAVAEARDGICTICHVRLRPQVFNTVRRNDQIVRCDSCHRILYFVAPAPAGVEGVTQPAS